LWLFKIKTAMNEIIITSKSDLQELIQCSVKKALSDQKLSQKDVVQDILDIQEAAEFLKLKVTTIYSYTSKSQIPFIKRGKKLYFEKSKLEAWLKEGKHESISEIRKRLGGQQDVKL
jgi:excisionase family DNA binding protein